jgi:integration host factor subunit beta
MLKSDLITILVERRGMTEAQAEATVETILTGMADALCAGEGIEIRGFGSFHVKQYDAYEGRNPKTGQVITVKAKRHVHWSTGKELRDRMNARTSEPAGRWCEPGFYERTPAAEVAVLGAEEKALGPSIDALTGEWEALEREIDAANAPELSGLPRCGRDARVPSARPSPLHHWQGQIAVASEPVRWEAGHPA